MSDLNVRRESGLTNTDIGLRWKKLEQECDNSNFFLSWTWIGTWLSCYRPSVELVEVLHKQQLIALGLIVRKTEWRHRLLKSRVMHLHQTGKPAEDQIWIEYNGLLCEARYRALAFSAMLASYDNDPDWDEIDTGAASAEMLNASDPGMLVSHETAFLPTYQIDLSVIRQQTKTYLQSVSRNLRYQINLTQRLYEQQGSVRLEFAGSKQEALAYFDQAAPFHRKKWSSTSGGSGFDNPKFVDFHKALISKAWEQDQIQICRLVVAGSAVAYLYNFSYKQRVYFYLSGIAQETNPKLKPGLLCHALCIQKNLNSEINIYDLMGGDMEYKRRLAQRGENLRVLRFQRPRAKLTFERWLRSSKAVFKQASLQGM